VELTVSSVYSSCDGEDNEDLDEDLDDVFEGSGSLSSVAVVVVDVELDFVGLLCFLRENFLFKDATFLLNLFVLSIDLCVM